MRPLNLMVGFWGENFRRFFSDFCLPSLLSPGNLGGLSCDDGHVFLICTTAEDWCALQQIPLWPILTKHAIPRLIEIGAPDDSSQEAKFRHMNLTHRLLFEAAHKERAPACH